MLFFTFSNFLISTRKSQNIVSPFGFIYYIRGSIYVLCPFCFIPYMGMSYISTPIPIFMFESPFTSKSTSKQCSKIPSTTPLFDLKIYIKNSSKFPIFPFQEPQSRTTQTFFEHHSILQRTHNFKAVSSIDNIPRNCR